MAVHLPGCTALRVRGLFGLATCQLLRRMEMESRLFVSPLQTPGGPVEDGKALALAAAAFSSSSSSSSLSVSVAEDANVERPLIRRVPSAASSSGSRRRRASIDLSSASRRPSFRQEVERAAAETYLVTRLAFTLLRYLGVGYRWITKFIALGCYALLLMPGFLQVGYYYFFSSQVRRSVVYGEQPRNRLDLYLPVNTDGLKPAVAFVTGGAWIIGYKAWGALLGRRLAERGVIVACIDYRIYLIGQSAGAHIAACALLDQAIGESGEGESISWSVSQIKAYFGISGGYNMLNLVDHFHRRGLYRSIFLSIMEGEQSLQRFSPEAMVQGSRVRHAVSLLPRVILFHGTSDYSIPSDASKTFADALQNAGAQAELVLYEGKTHTDLFLQDPFRGGKDELLEDIIAVVHADDAAALANDGAAPAARRLVPECMLQLASKISPF
ncbi:probable isoprenylcysteine alpha-carbonyl methylesterase ICMEL1 isoform X3 [Elaeis guineensis]|uniref:Probable isoprenylcysteine alpha-carbonyl methylesterase ICMEL1 isoform X3 n=1 Tax=Elaeis guineensis var. tenera TaxID=51953 RepID=A0A8N4FAS6_ELAGV|nr:probable isoprenylcysteine alpha-carbonyl methylesterase ICMEL1 isoform X3 [Elaeis guineensis]